MLSTLIRANRRQVAVKKRNDSKLSGLAFVNSGQLAVDITSRLKNTASCKKVVNKMAGASEPILFNSAVLENLRHVSEEPRANNNWLSTAVNPTRTVSKCFSKKDLKTDFKWPRFFSTLPNFHDQSIFGNLGITIAGSRKAFSYVDLFKFSSENAVACYYADIFVRP